MKNFSVTKLKKSTQPQAMDFPAWLIAAVCCAAAAVQLCGIETALAAGAGHEPAGLDSLFWPVVNFVTYLFVMIFIYRKFVKSALQNRLQQIKSDLDRSAQSMRLAQQEFNDAEERLKLIASEQAELVERYEVEGKQMGEAILRNARLAAERSLKDAARQIETETSQAEKELRRESIMLATTLVRKRLQAQLKDDEDRRIRRMVVSEVVS